MDRATPRRILLATMAIGAGAALPGVRADALAMTTGRPLQHASRSARREAQATPGPSKDLWLPWVAIWNGDFSRADEFIAPDFVAHFVPMAGSPDEVRGPDGLTGWIAGITAAFSEYRFETTVGPLADGDLLAGRWRFEATYRGGIPGSSPDAVGQPVAYAGIDILRVEAGQIAEYWLSADVLDLLQQIGVVPS